MKYLILGLLLMCCWAQIGYAYSSPIAPQFVAAANRHGVPAEVFYSLLLLESGYSVNGKTAPWPWTLNVNHQPYRYTSYTETKLALEKFLKDPKNTIAVGAGQIYLPAHGHVFKDVMDLVDPQINLDYSAKLLASEFEYLKGKGLANWWTAAGRYHAPNNKYYARLYRSIVFTKCRKFSFQCTMYGKIS